jgi:hypothetical protein
MSTNSFGLLSVNSIFLDENMWVRSSLLSSFFAEIQKSGVIEKFINLQLNKSKFKGKKDDKLFEWLIDTMNETERVWLITRDKSIFNQVPQFFRKHVLVLNGFENIRQYTYEIKLYCLIIIILCCVNIKAQKLIKVLTRLLHNYIEEVIYELKII